MIIERNGEKLKLTNAELRAAHNEYSLCCKADDILSMLNERFEDDERYNLFKISNAKELKKRCLTKFVKHLKCSDDWWYICNNAIEEVLFEMMEENQNKIEGVK